ncbi:hypothetical protein Rhe02_75150 [Rhizocola hellebori]|uniref:Uncharacterized protein n=1 Tax=Rhizocola hellebori TaxID=1392758 RepID=A0A8J3VKV2_9ACTN|nr:hypothetical protein [Rhizocola hellebori]GIH09448.1 hypothetical protein Rhe02_75150 [Rhizocola hellebori]
MPDTQDQVVLTAAELSYLIASSPSTTQLGSRAAEVVGLTSDERHEASVSAGFSSLIARGLAISDGNQVTLAPSTSAVSDALSQSQVNIQIGLVAAERADGAILFKSERVRLLLSPRRHRCFDLVGLDPRGDLPGQLLAITRDFLGRYRPGVVTIVVDTAGRGTPSDLGWTTVAADTDAQSWSVVFGREPSDIDRGVGEEQAVHRMRGRLQELLA